MSFFKRGVVFEGLDCVADSSTAAFKAAGSANQKEIPWMSNAAYGKYTVYYGVVVVFIALLKYGWFKYKDYRYMRSLSLLSFFSSVMFVLASYGRFVGYKQVPAKVSLLTSLPPSGGSSLFMAVTLFYLLCYCLIPHFWYRSCFGFGSPPIAVRAGVMATALSPFIYVLSGKSNFITLVTGISYEKLNVLHQFTGVAMFILSLIHTIPFIYQPMREGGSAWLKMQYDFAYYSGIPPLLLLAWLCIGSKNWVRKAFYEGFYHLHWMCGFAFVGTMVWHIDKSFNMQYYFWVTIALWGAQMVYRLVIKTAFKPNALFLRTREAELKKLADNVYEVSIANAKGLTWSPGQHCFLRFCGTRILDNHPFSIVSIKDDDMLRFIVMPKKGLTKKLYDSLDDYASQKKAVYVDGPYGGTSRDIRAFDNVLLMASGTGATATLPFLLALANHIAVTKATSQTLITRTIRFVWIVRHIEDVQWFRRELIESVQKASVNIAIDIYVTEPSSVHAEETKEIEEGDKVALKNQDLENTYDRTLENSFFPEEISIHYHKPDVKKLMAGLRLSLLRRNIIVCSGSDSMKSAISSCAAAFQTAIFNNDVHYTSVEEVYLHTETFGW